MRWMFLFSLLSACDEAPPDEPADALAVEASPPVNPALAVGRTYLLDASSRQWTGTMVTLDVLLQATGLAVSDQRAFTVFAEQGNRAAVRFGTLHGNRQDMCALTNDIPLDLHPGARWGAQPASGFIGTVAQVDLPYENVMLYGRLDGGGRSVSDIRFEGIADLRPLSALGVGDLCDIVPIAGTNCVACSDGTPNCIDVSFDHAIATEVQVPRLARVDAASRAARGCP